MMLVKQTFGCSGPEMSFLTAEQMLRFLLKINHRPKHWSLRARVEYEHANSTRNENMRNTQKEGNWESFQQMNILH